MNIIDFGLAVRFAENYGRKYLQELTQALCAQDVAGLELYAGEMQDLRYGQGNVYLCVFTKGKITQMRHVFHILSEDAGVVPLLCQNMPFIQTNALEDLAPLTYLGEIKEDGTLTQTQQIAFAENRTERKKMHDIPHGLIVAADCDDGLSARESIMGLKSFVKEIQMHGIHASPKRMQAVDSFFDFGGGTAHMLKAANGQTLRMGVLNGQIAILEAEENSETLQFLIERAKNEGLKQIWIDARFGTADGWENTGNGIICLKDERAFMQAQCDYGKLEGKLKGMSFACIVGPEKATLPWVELCESNHVRLIQFGCMSSLEQLREAVSAQWK